MITAARYRLIPLMELLNITLPWQLQPQQETGIRTPLAAFFNIPLMCLVLLGMVGCGGFQNIVIVPVTPRILTFLNLGQAFTLTQADAGEVNEAGDQFGGIFVAAGDLNIQQFHKWYQPVTRCSDHLHL